MVRFGNKNFGRAKNKFNAIKSGGFSSKLEHAVYQLLLEKEKLGLISEIKSQQSVELQDGPRETSIRWRVDFSFTEDGKTVYCEAKGVETGEYKLKLKMWRFRPPAKLYIYKGSFRNPKLVETIECTSSSSPG